MNDNWRARVYKKRQKEALPEDWDSLRKRLIRDAKFTCLRCDKNFRSFVRLTIHHLVPRSDGGSDDPTNLVVLCYKCHDFVEINNLRTEAEIIGSYGIDEIEVKTIEECEDSRPDWHAWVYGGARNPKL